MSHHCPKCQRLLYSRRLPKCGFCGTEIPENLRFTPEEIAALEQEVAELARRRKERHQAADIQAEEEEYQRREEEIRRLLGGY